MLISDSGGAPAVIARYLKTGKIELDPTGERGFKPPSNSADLKKWEAQVARIKALHEKHKVLTAFSTRQGETRNLDLVLLKAMLFDTDGNLRQSDLNESKKMLHLAIDWGRAEVVAQWMEKSAEMFAVPVRHAPSEASSSAPNSPRLSAHASGGGGASVGVADPAVLRLNEHAFSQRMKLSRELQQALQQALHIALKHQKAGIVDLLLKSNLQAADVELLELYDETLDHLTVFEADLQQLRKGLRLHIAQLDDEAASGRLGGRRSSAAATPAHARTARPSDGWQALPSMREHLGAIMTGVRASMRFVGGTPSGGSGGAGFSATGPRGSGGGGGGGNDFAARADARNQQAYAQLVVPFLAKACKLESVDELWKSGQVDRWTADDVFYWAVLMSDERLVQVLWRHVDEPIRMALVASQMSSQLAAIARFDSVRFANLAHKYEGWACGVLSQCDNELEARWLLQKPFNVMVPGRTGGTLITLAIRTNRKAFIAHTHAQSLLDAWWRGDVVGAFDEESGAGSYCLSSSDPHALLVIAHALTFGLLRLVRMEQTLAAKHVLLSKQQRHAFQMQHTHLARLRKPSSREHASIFHQMQYETDHRPDRARMLRDFYAAPKSKFWLRATSYLAFLLLYALVIICDDGTPDVSWLELAFMLWVGGLAVDELHQWVTNRRLHRSHFADIWNVLDALMFAVLFPAIFVMRTLAYFTCCAQPWRSLDTDAAGVALRRPCSCDVQVHARTILAANAVICFFRFLANYKVHPRLGVLIHVITEIQNDVGMFIAILLFVVLGFAFAFSGLSPPRHLQLQSDASSPFLIPVWNLFDLSDVGDVTEHSEAPALGMALLASYLFLSQILLVNLLIAMMNQSYAQAHKNAEEEWAASRASSIEELLILSPVPPPFSMPYLLYDMLARSKRGTSAGAEPALAPPPAAHTGSYGGAAEQGSAGKKRRNVKLLHEYLEECWRTDSLSVESRVTSLRDDVDRLTSMVESASADRADSRAVLDRLTAESMRTLKEMQAGLEKAGLVAPRASASAEPHEREVDSHMLAVPPARARAQPAAPPLSLIHI